MRTRTNEWHQGIVGRHAQVFRASVVRAVAEKIACDAIGEGGLADPRRAGNQPGLRRTSAANGARRAQERLVLADERKRFARMWLPGDPVGLDDFFLANAPGHGIP